MNYLPWILLAIIGLWGWYNHVQVRNIIKQNSDQVAADLKAEEVKLIGFFKSFWQWRK